MYESGKIPGVSELGNVVVESEGLDTDLID